MEELSTKQIEKHFTANMNVSKKDIIIGNFLGGLSWGLGSVLGATVVIAAVGTILNTLGVFATIGQLFAPLGNINQSLPQIPQLPR